MGEMIAAIQERQVVNIADGRCLGHIRDVLLDVRRGRIYGLVVPQVTGPLRFWQSQEEAVIQWQQVVRIGVDVVLVDAPQLVQQHSGKQRSRKKLAEQRQEQQEK